MEHRIRALQSPSRGYGVPTRAAEGTAKFETLCFGRDEGAVAERRCDFSPGVRRLTPETGRPTSYPG